MVSNSLLTLLVHPEIPFEINQKKIVATLGFVFDETPDTIMEDVTVVKPGHYIEIENSTFRDNVFYLPNPKHRIDDASSKELADEFRRLLEQSVERRIAGLERFGSMLSGGLDSVPMTIIAAQKIKQSKNLHALTWCFEEFYDSDERKYISGIPEQFGFSHHQIMCDHDWPSITKDVACSPLMPIIDPYVSFHLKLEGKIKALELDVVLNGVGGDSLYTDTYNVIYELLLQGDFKAALKESRFRHATEDSTWSFIKACLIKPLPFVNRINNLRRVTHYAEWLTDEACKLLGDDKRNWLTPYAQQARRPKQYEACFSLLEGNSAHESRIVDGKVGFEKRFPFRDRELLEFMVALPSKYLYSNNITRPIVRSSCSDIMPDVILNRVNKTDFYPTIEKYMLNSTEIDELLAKNDELIDRTVKAEYLDKNNPKTHYFAIHRWYSGYYNHWLKNCYNRLIENRVNNYVKNK